MAKQTTITIETTSLVVLRGRNSGRAWCAQCAAERDMVAVENIEATPPNSQALQEWVDLGELHRLKAADGSQLICLNSLLARVQSAKSR